MEWKNANKILPERGHRVLCLYPNGKMDVQLYLGRESLSSRSVRSLYFLDGTAKTSQSLLQTHGAQ